jgi:hypothetical protein
MLFDLVIIASAMLTLMYLVYLYEGHDIIIPTVASRAVIMCN